MTRSGTGTTKKDPCLYSQQHVPGGPLPGAWTHAPLTNIQYVHFRHRITGSQRDA